MFGKERGKCDAALRACGSGIGIFLLAFGALAIHPAEVRAEKVVMMMSFLLNGRHSWYFAARENGYYREAGLDVEIRRGYGGADTIKKIAAGAAEFCETDLGNVVVGRSQGAHLKMVSIHLRKAPYAIVALRKSGIAKPKDLEGKTIGFGQQADAIWTLFPGYARIAGVEMSKIQSQGMAPSAKVPALLAGKVDAITGFLDTLVGVLRAQGKAINVLSYADAGFNMYSSGIAISEATAAKTDRVKRFVKASNKGVSWTIDNREKAVALMAKQTGQGAKGLQAQLNISIELLGDAAKPENRSKLGYMDPAEVSRSVEIVNEYMKINDPVKPEDVYTNAFLN